MDNQGMQRQSVFDQLGATVTDFSSVVFAYYAALLKAGMPEERAFELTSDWHAMYWQHSLDA